MRASSETSKVEIVSATGRLAKGRQAAEKMGTQKTRRYCDDHGSVLAERQTPNHVLHLLLAVVTVGFWIPVWILVAVFGNSPWRCPHCGERTSS